MFTPTPHTLLTRQLALLTGHLPGVFDADVESVHQARIATRRIRELAPLMNEDDATADLTAVVRKAGRELGRVRELDVMQARLDDLAREEPHVAAVCAAAAASVRDYQERARRAMVKALERLDLRSRLAWPTGRRWRHMVAARWPSQLRERIRARAAELAAAEAHATGVYFPNRAHRVRIAAKKLRYALEVADRTQMWQPPRLLKDLKRIQDILGRMHDEQVLLDEIDSLAGDTPVRTDLPLLRRMLDSGLRRDHASYLQRRTRLRAMCEACGRFADHRHGYSGRRPLVAAVSTVAPLLLVAARRSR